MVNLLGISTVADIDTKNTDEKTFTRHATTKRYRKNHVTNREDVVIDEKCEKKVDKSKSEANSGGHILERKTKKDLVT